MARRRSRCSPSRSIAASSSWASSWGSRWASWRCSCSWVYCSPSVSPTNTLTTSARRRGATPPAGSGCRFCRCSRAWHLGFFEVTVLTAVSVAISTRMPMLVNLVVCISIFFLGHLTPVLVSITGAGNTNELVHFMAQLFAVRLARAGILQRRPGDLDGFGHPLGGLRFAGPGLLHVVQWSSDFVRLPPVRGSRPGLTSARAGGTGLDSSMARPSVVTDSGGGRAWLLRVAVALAPTRRNVVPVASGTPRTCNRPRTIALGSSGPLAKARSSGPRCLGSSIRSCSSRRS